MNPWCYTQPYQWPWITYMFIRLYGFINPIKFPLPVQLDTTFLCKYLWNSSTVECQSVQTYPFKVSEGELATMICLSLLQALVQNRERPKENLQSFFLCVFRVNAACQREDLLRPQRKTFSWWWKHDGVTWVAQANFCSTVTVITLGELWHPTLVEKNRKKKSHH